MNYVGFLLPYLRSLKGNKYRSCNIMACFKQKYHTFIDSIINLFIIMCMGMRVSCWVRVSTDSRLAKT